MFLMSLRPDRCQLTVVTELPDLRTDGEGPGHPSNQGRSPQSENTLELVIDFSCRITERALLGVAAYCGPVFVLGGIEQMYC
jgi:hypothetical protein